MMHLFASVIFDLLIQVEKIPYNSGLFLDFPTFLSKQYSGASALSLHSWVVLAHIDKLCASLCSLDYC